jgi:hypothetical protein
LAKISENCDYNIDSRPVPEPKTTIVGNEELFIEAGSTINLTCTIQTGPTSDSLIYWNYNGKVSL